MNEKFSISFIYIYKLKLQWIYFFTYHIGINPSPGFHPLLLPKDIVPEIFSSLSWISFFPSKSDHSYQYASMLFFPSLKNPQRFEKNLHIGACHIPCSVLEVPRPWTRGPGAHSWPLQGPQPRLRPICLLPSASVGKTPPGPLGICARSHRSHRGTFVPGWMPSCYWGWDMNKECLFYSAMLLTSLHQFCFEEPTVGSLA